MRGRIEMPRLDSRMLRGNALGDPSEREVLVYLPPDYDAHGRRLPVVYVLPPYAAGHRTLVNYRPWEPTIFDRYERLLTDGRVAEAILVAPDCMTRYGGSQFIDSPGTGRYQSYVADEVVPFVDAQYRTIPRRDGRAVIGRSSGGFGALRFALDRPDVFCAYASHAGDAAFEISVRPSFTSVAITLDRAGGLGPFLARFSERGPTGGGDFEVIMTVASAAAYAPDPSVPGGGALPFDVRTALPIDDVWARWLAHDPLVRVRRDQTALRDAKLLFLDGGDRDEHGLHFAARLLADALRDRLGAALVHEEFPGGHRGTEHRYEASLPRVTSVLSTS